MLIAMKVIDRYVPKPTQTDFAKAVLESQDIHEDSWDGKKYTKSHHEASKEAVELYLPKSGYTQSEKDFWTDIIGDANTFFWNDVQLYAFCILKSVGITVWKNYNFEKKEVIV
jgi:hypothetical protein